MKEIVLLDTCCKAGGCSVGYKRAADELRIPIKIIGVDIEPQPHYPFEFVQANAIDFLQDHVIRIGGGSFTHFHSSPPCQAFSTATQQFRAQGKEYPDIVNEVRQLMAQTGKPGVIENVMGAPIRRDIVLRGDMFGLKVLRNRKFECINWFSLSPLPPAKRGSVRNGDYLSVFGKAGIKKDKNGQKPNFMKNTIRETWAYAMGIDWHMTDVELGEAIPPAYTHWIGMQLFDI